MYMKPNDKQVKAAMNCGWDAIEATRGYGIFEYGDTRMFEIERIDDCYVGFTANDPYCEDRDCAIEAARSGFCKIIPIAELPKRLANKIGCPNYYGWIDTPKNRKAIAEYCSW